MNKTLQITVTGGIKSGKTTVARLIARTLREHGIAVTAMDDSWPSAKLLAPERLAGLRAAGLSAHVSTEQLHAAEELCPEGCSGECRSDAPVAAEEEVVSEDNKLYINIVGGPKTGKTTILRVIEEALDAAGIVHEDATEAPLTARPQRTLVMHENCVEALNARGLRVETRLVQLAAQPRSNAAPSEKTNG